MVAMFEAACKLSGRQGEDTTPAEIKKIRDAKPLNSPCDPSSDTVLELTGADIANAEEDLDQPTSSRTTIVACPEHSHPGESQSNGKAEAAVKSVVNQARTLKVALEPRLMRATPFFPARTRSSHGSLSMLGGCSLNSRSMLKADAIWFTSRT